MGEGLLNTRVVLYTTPVSSVLFTYGKKVASDRNGKGKKKKIDNPQATFPTHFIYIYLFSFHYLVCKWVLTV